MDRISSGTSRRVALGAIPAIACGLTGCLSSETHDGVGDAGATDVAVYNAATTAKTVALTVTEEGAERPHTSTTLTLSPGELVDDANSGKLPTQASGYTVEVAVADGPSETFEWTDPTVELAPLWIRLDGSRNIRFLLQAG